MMFKLTRLSLALGLAAGMTLGLSACVSPPKEDTRITQIDSSKLGLSQNNSPRAAEGWWKVFGDAQLNQLIDDALVNSPSLGEALIRVRGAQAQAIAAGAKLRPGFAIDADETYQRLSENYIYPPKELGLGLSGGDKAWLGQTTLGMSWDLDFWGEQENLLKQARNKVVAAELDSATARLMLSGAMAQSYVDLFRSYALADIAQQNERQRETMLKITKSRVNAGLDTQLELKVAEAALPQARTARLQAEIQRDIAIHNLAALSGHGADAYDKIGRPQIAPDATLPLPNELTLDLLSRRPDILAAKARVEAATAGRAAAKAAFYPDINLKAFVGVQAVGLDKLSDSGSAIYGAGPALHLPVFDSQRLKAGYIGATAELDEAVASYNETLLKAVRDVADQLSRLESLKRQLAEANQTSMATEAAYKLAQSRYQAGLSSQLVVLNAETQVLNSRRDLVSLNTQLLITRVTLLLTFGGSFDPTSYPALAQGVTHE
ncbi:outer membrane protein [Cellvibrio zantedeschiae]|uniref:Outer membrane protein n=1 Tax=Cellvibrio zantedeschiae TaxID=1237077 RepID=A0ABQ3B3S9_9GAMM|nr:efflux transporter outer membrane subunit [Cellvibrio zantedeschiae]GGY78082.1 outer membrane protein [Cellvibrio zantedeschiae]